MVFPGSVRIKNGAISRGSRAPLRSSGSFPEFDSISQLENHLRALSFLLSPIVLSMRGNECDRNGRSNERSNGQKKAAELLIPARRCVLHTADTIRIDSRRSGKGKTTHPKFVKILRLPREQ